MSKNYYAVSWIDSDKNSDELMHYGKKGMRWHKKSKNYKEIYKEQAQESGQRMDALKEKREKKQKAKQSVSNYRKARASGKSGARAFISSIAK